ncbi:hypothetical protein WJX81_004729 [Elliptochloris bilobata]|uniref:Uncharacterized protein n=1 Tax=Elliptochloris bilobata TaxID=381761 RepID=A0AAW1RIU2_9CHLO
MDGPDVTLFSVSNLGAMSTVLESGGVTRADELAMREAIGTFRAGGRDFAPAVDPLAIAGSCVLLLVLLGIAFERVLGLDQLVAQALRQWREGQRERERRAVMDARVRLEDEYNKPD